MIVSKFLIGIFIDFFKLVDQGVLKNQSLTEQFYTYLSEIYLSEIAEQVHKHICSVCVALCFNCEKSESA